MASRINGSTRGRCEWDGSLLLKRLYIPVKLLFVRLLKRATVNDPLDVVHSGFQLVLVHRFTLALSLHSLLQRSDICLQLVTLVIAQLGPRCGLLQVGYQLSRRRFSAPSSTSLRSRRTTRHCDPERAYYSYDLLVHPSTPWG